MHRFIPACAGNTRPRLPALPPARTVAAAERQIRAAVDRETTDLGLVSTPVGEVALSDEFIRHVSLSRAHRERFAAEIVPTLRDPAEVWLQAVWQDGRVVYRPVFVGDRGGLVVAQENGDGTVGWTFYIEARMKRRRKGYLLYRRSGV